MNVKKLFTLVFLAMALTAHANPGETLTATTMVPTGSVVLGKECAIGSGDAQAYSCMILTTIAPISSTTVLALVALKEEVAQVEQDAYNFMAGEGLSEALKEMINAVKAEQEELAHLSDKEVAAILVETLNFE
jgi:hypothetical protein